VPPEMAKRILDEIQERARVVDLVDPEPCCARRLNRALFGGHEGDSWTCPQCGCDWTAQRTEGQAGTIRRWSARPAFVVLR
jgi:hypothetical protein